MVEKESVVAKRKSVSQVEARRLAREHAAEAQKRQEQLLGLAEHYFVAAGETDAVNEKLAADIDKIRDDAEAKIAQRRDQSALASRRAEESAADVVVQMLALVSVKETAERLGVPATEVRRLRTLAQSDSGSGEPGATAEAQGPSTGAGEQVG